MELRKDPITRSWVLIGDSEPGQPSDSRCMYCFGNEGSSSRPILSLPLPGSASRIQVFPHPRPFYRIEGKLDRHADGIYDKMAPIGAHEIIVEGPDHDGNFSSHPESMIATLLECWAMRIDDLKKDLRFKHVTLFKNRGELAGQELRHPHAEVTATPFIPRRVLYELRASQEYFQRKERCVLCDIGRQEEQRGQRVVEVTRNYIVGCPFASRLPFELWIMPRYHASSFEADLLSRRDHSELAGVVRRALARLEQVTGNYHMVLHTSPNTRARTELGGYWTTIEQDYHWHFEILPITELQSRSYTVKEVYYSQVTPEQAAERLKALPTTGSLSAQTKLEFQAVKG